MIGATLGEARADALQGKRLYLDAARLAGTPDSCVDCHGGLPGGAFGIGAAANAPDLIMSAIDSVPDMTPFRDRLGAQDCVDLAAYIGDPLVPSPAVALVAPDGRVLDHIDLGEVELGSQARVVFRLANPGQLPLALTGASTITGRDAAELELSSTCALPSVIAPGGGCDFTLDFRPAGGAGPRLARFAVDHDWVRSPAALAVLGTAVPAAASDGDADATDEAGDSDGIAGARDGACDGGAGGSPVGALLVLARRRRRRPQRGAAARGPTGPGRMAAPTCGR